MAPTLGSVTGDQTGDHDWLNPEGNPADPHYSVNGISASTV
jgi:hypothetical protein